MVAPPLAGLLRDPPWQLRHPPRRAVRGHPGGDQALLLGRQDPRTIAGLATFCQYARTSLFVRPRKWPLITDQSHVPATTRAKGRLLACPFGRARNGRGLRPGLGRENLCENFIECEEVEPRKVRPANGLRLF
jgi:hypothetical protein